MADRLRDNPSVSSCCGGMSGQSIYTRSIAEPDRRPRHLGRAFCGLLCRSLPCLRPSCAGSNMDHRTCNAGRIGADRLYRADKLSKVASCASACCGPCRDNAGCGTASIFCIELIDAVRPVGYRVDVGCLSCRSIADLRNLSTRPEYFVRWMWFGPDAMQALLLHLSVVC